MQMYCLKGENASFRHFQSARFYISRSQMKTLCFDEVPTPPHLTFMHISRRSGEHCGWGVADQCSPLWLRALEQGNLSLVIPFAWLWVPLAPVGHQKTCLEGELSIAGNTVRPRGSYNLEGNGLPE